MDNLAIKKAILDKIKEYQNIIITRHKRPDGDAIGSTKGLQAILKASFPQKEIVVCADDSSDYLAFLGGMDEPIHEERYRDALVIVLDTATKDRISNQYFVSAGFLIKIDHHPNHEPYGDIVWVEDERSSLCELIVDFYRTFQEELTMTKEAATYLYTGMVTDSGRFRYQEVGGETLRNAAVLLDMGIETEWIFSNLYLDDYDALKFKAYVYKKMRTTENGVTYIYVDKRMRKKFNLSNEEASNVVSAIGNIKGSLVWLAFIDNDSGDIRVRLRSRYVAISPIAEAYNGGGHAFASGATLKTKKEIAALLADADALLKNYKENNEGWL